MKCRALMQRDLVVIEAGECLHPALSPISNEAERAFWKERLASICSVPVGRFPGSNPVSLERSNLSTIHTKTYLAALKSDGIRYILMLSESRCGAPTALMIDRSFNIFEVEVWANPSFFSKGTALDGELVRDFTNDTPRLAFLVFDALVVCGDRVRATYSDRLQLLNQLILSSHDDVGTDLETVLVDENRICAVNNHMGMQLFPKKFVPASKVRQLWSGRLHSAFRHDGLILTCNDYSDVSAASFKWKLDHTVDVLADVDESGKWKISVGHAGSLCNITNHILLQDRTEATRKVRTPVVFEQNELLQCLLVDTDEPKRHILECACSFQDKALHLFCIKVRRDKANANSLFVVQKTILNMHENISLEELAVGTKDVL